MEDLKYICPICKETFKIDKYKAKKKKTPFCQKCVTIGTQKGIKRPQFSKENSKRWKGGNYLTSDGYKMIKCENKFDNSGRQKYKKEHILIYENYLGRELKTQRGYMGEQVHHIDGDKLNNSIENLELCEDTRVHRNLHCQLEKIAFELVKNGIIFYDKKTKKYLINESRIT